MIACNNLDYPRVGNNQELNEGSELHWFRKPMVKCLAQIGEDRWQGHGQLPSPV